MVFCHKRKEGYVCCLYFCWQISWVKNSDHRIFSDFEKFRNVSVILKLVYKVARKFRWKRLILFIFLVKELFKFLKLHQLIHGVCEKRLFVRVCLEIEGMSLDIRRITDTDMKFEIPDIWIPDQTEITWEYFFFDIWKYQ